MKSRTRIMRISEELDKELKEFAKKNNKKLIDATMDAARILRTMRGKKVNLEIKF